MKSNTFIAISELMEKYNLTHEEVVDAIRIKIDMKERGISYDIPQYLKENQTKTKNKKQ